MKESYLWKKKERTKGSKKKTVMIEWEQDSHQKGLQVKERNFTKCIKGEWMEAIYPFNLTIEERKSK